MPTVIPSSLAFCDVQHQICRNCVLFFSLSGFVWCVCTRLWCGWFYYIAFQAAHSLNKRKREYWMRGHICTHEKSIHMPFLGGSIFLPLPSSAPLLIEKILCRIKLFRKLSLVILASNTISTRIIDLHWFLWLRMERIGDWEGFEGKPSAAALLDDSKWQSNSIAKFILIVDGFSRSTHSERVHMSFV